MAPVQPSRQQVINYAAQEARRVGLPSSWFVAMLHAESGFRPEVGLGQTRSTAGAIGYAQLMPGTAEGLGVNPYDWKQNIQGGARYLKTQYDRFKKMPLALSAYNSGPGGAESSGRIEGFAETQAYVARVVELEKRYRNLGTAEVADAQVTVPPPGMTNQTPVALPRRPMTPAPSGPYLDALTQLGPLSARVAEQAARFEPSAPAPPVPQQEGPTPSAGAFQPKGTAVGQPAGATADWRKWVVTPTWSHASGAAEPGEAILSFVGGMGKVAGEALEVWDTTRHSQYTTNNTVSKHWTGDALDIPAEGDRLIRLGRIALMNAGMPRAKAMKAGPGLYNVGGYQVIFGTNSAALGGDHTDHVHVGLRGEGHKH